MKKIFCKLPVEKNNNNRQQQQQQQQHQIQQQQIQQQQIQQQHFVWGDDKWDINDHLESLRTMMMDFEIIFSSQKRPWIAKHIGVTTPWEK